MRYHRPREAGGAAALVGAAVPQQASQDGEGRRGKVPVGGVAGEW
jgi:hypothetical protein